MTNPQYSIINLQLKWEGKMQEECSTIGETEKTFEAIETTEVTSENAARIAILDMGKTWENTGDVYQAVITYKDLIEAAPKTPEAGIAKEGLLRIAKVYQKKGSKHTALSLYKYVMAH
jgi:tetratricopeptide (TPR) repeat protein